MAVIGSLRVLHGLVRVVMISAWWSSYSAIPLQTAATAGTSVARVINVDSILDQELPPDNNFVRAITHRGDRTLHYARKLARRVKNAAYNRGGRRAMLFVIYRIYNSFQLENIDIKTGCSRPAP